MIFLMIWGPCRDKHQLAPFVGIAGRVIDAVSHHIHLVQPSSK